VPHRAAERCDVLVVGGGGSGLAAAIEAAAAGSRTVLLEKNSFLGGSTAWSVGSVTASRTLHQRKAGIVDRPEWHCEDMPLFPQGEDARDNVELRGILCSELPDTFEWLLSLGIRFFGPIAEPPHRVPRMHTVLPNSRSFIHHLQKHARRVGVDIRVAASVTNLLTREGVVRGVCYRTDAGEHVLESGAVVLAAGDFTNDAVLKQRFMGSRAARVPGINKDATGDGQKLAEAVGGVIVNGELALGPELRFQAPPRRHLASKLPPWTFVAHTLEWSVTHLPGAILRPILMKFLTTALAPSKSLFAEGALLVDRMGQVLDTDDTDPANSVAGTPTNEGFIILHSDTCRKFERWPNYVSTAPGMAYAYLSDYIRTRKDVCHVSQSLEALAKAIGVQADALRETFVNRAPGSVGPYCALGPVAAVFVHSEGGLSVDTSHRVLNELRRPIGGLYAAGSTGQGGLLLRGHGHHLAWAFVSGRRAGRNAARHCT
jgi:succinate dehydrogenase/fumarate reductase flavoprotein subunit